MKELENITRNDTLKTFSEEMSTIHEISKPKEIQEDIVNLRDVNRQKMKYTIFTIEMLMYLKNIVHSKINDR